MFVAYIGLLNVGVITFDSGVPAIATLNQPALWLFLIGLVLTIILLVCNVKGAILIGMVVTTVIGIPMGVTTMADSVSFTEALRRCRPRSARSSRRKACRPCSTTSRSSRSCSSRSLRSASPSTFDTIGTFIGTGRRAGIFSEEDEKTMDKSSGFKSKMDKALFADATATSIGAIFGTSNTTTLLSRALPASRRAAEPASPALSSPSALRISAFLATFVSAIPYAATAPALWRSA